MMTIIFHLDALKPAGFRFRLKANKDFIYMVLIVVTKQHQLNFLILKYQMGQGYTLKGITHMENNKLIIYLLLLNNCEFQYLSNL